MAAKTEGRDSSTTPAYLFEAPLIDPSDPAAYQTTWYCPPLLGNKKAVLHLRAGGEMREIRNPFQKPLLLMSAIIHRFSPPNSVVVDFTAGSGTTAAACAWYPQLLDRTGRYRRFTDVWLFLLCSAVLCLAVQCFLLAVL